MSEDTTEIVCELFKVGKIIGRKNIGQTHLIGQIAIAIAKIPAIDVSEQDSTSHMAFSEYMDVVPEDYPLFGAHGEPTSEEIRMQAIVVTTSRTPRSRHEFAEAEAAGAAF